MSGRFPVHYASLLLAQHPNLLDGFVSFIYSMHSLFLVSTFIISVFPTLCFSPRIFFIPVSPYLLRRYSLCAFKLNFLSFPSFFFTVSGLAVLCVFSVLFRFIVFPPPSTRCKLFLLFSTVIFWGWGCFSPSGLFPLLDLCPLTSVLSYCFPVPTPCPSLCYYM